jgi:hypothetical protein
MRLGRGRGFGTVRVSRDIGRSRGRVPRKRQSQRHGYTLEVEAETMKIKFQVQRPYGWYYFITLNSTRAKTVYAGFIDTTAWNELKSVQDGEVQISESGC